MKKKLLALLLLGCIACGSFAACGGKSSGDNGNSTPATSQPDSSTSEAPEVEAIDYAASITLDMNSTATIKQEVSVKLFIDGDTTHFDVPTSVVANGVLKARYLAVNTPESTGKIEEWGKTASNFTKSKLESAQSIVLETDKDVWEVDSTGERRLVWVW